MAGTSGSTDTDVLGLLIAVIVVAASVHDNAIGITLLDQVAADNPTVTKGWVDAGFKNAVVEHGRSLGIDVEVVSRAPQTKGSPRRRGGGSLSRPSAPSCCTAGWPATTRGCPPVRHP
ncbi:hypothetical protein [Streptomyces sp. NPDC055099]